MKKKLLMLGASMLILGNSQISYGAAAFALEDDPSRRMSVPGERVDAALKDQMAREDEAKARHDVESHDTSFTRIGVKGLLRAGEQETLICLI
jgi:flagellar biosynthesis component FlhA